MGADNGSRVELQALNSNYAKGTGDGQLELDFGGAADNASGIFNDPKLNPDPTFNFDEVFRVRNPGGFSDGRVVIEARGFELETLELTADGAEATAISSGTSLRAADYDDVDNLPKLVQPDAVDVNVTIETKSDTTMGDVGGELIIHYATGGNRDRLADVL